MEVTELTEHCIRDNDQAQKDGVRISTHPQQQQQAPQPQSPTIAPPPQCFLRTLQWNIQAWTSPAKERSPSINQGIMDTIVDADADVMTLNEYHWCDRGTTQDVFEHHLREQGYTFFCACNMTPTLVATRCRVLQYEEIPLSWERSAMCLKIEIRHTGVVMWVIGTHLDAFDGQQRTQEIQRLLKYLRQKKAMFDERTPMVIAGDFNPQRQRDYHHDEWQRIQESMDRRNVCRDDGVAKLLEGQQFRCVFDRLQTQHSLDNHVRSNWELASCPPSTHWSGTTIDYSYSRNLPIHGVYVSPAGFSDHRMTVCDWNMNETDAIAQLPRSEKSSFQTPVTAFAQSSNATATTTTTTIATSLASSSSSSLSVLGPDRTAFTPDTRDGARTVHRIFQPKMYTESSNRRCFVAA